MFSASLSRAAFSRPLMRVGGNSITRQFLTYSTSGPSLNWGRLSTLSNNQKLLLSATGYLLACLGVASMAERKNFSHVFKQLGEW